MSSLYLRSNLGRWLRHFRVNSRNHTVCTQSDLAKLLFSNQQTISRIEKGDEEPDLAFISSWCEVTGWREGWEIVANIFQLDPFSVPPVHPEMSERLSDSISNMRQQLLSALDSLDEIEKVNNKRRPGRLFEINTTFKNQLVDHFDLLPAVKSMMYAAERDIGLDIKEITQSWTKGCVADHVVMPTMSQLDQREGATL